MGTVNCYAVCPDTSVIGLDLCFPEQDLNGLWYSHTGLSGLA